MQVVRCNRDGFRDRTNLQRKVSDDVILHIKVKLHHSYSLEPELSCRNQVVARVQGRNRVESVLIRFHSYGKVRLNVLDFYLGIGNYTSGLIGHAPIHTSKFSLRDSGGRKYKASYKEC